MGEVIQSLGTLIDLLTRAEFLAGALTAAVAVGLASRLDGSRALALVPRPLTSPIVLVSFSALLAAHLTVGRRLGLVAGVGLLTAASMVPWKLARVALMLSGVVVVVVRGPVEGPPWVALGAMAMIAATAASSSALSSSATRDRFVWLGLFVSVFGVWAAVPNTDAARVLMGTTITSAVVAPRIGRTTLVEHFPLAAVLVWAASTGTPERPGSAVGAWLCLGSMFLLAVALDRASPRTSMAIHVIAVLASSRFVGFSSDLPEAVVRSALAAPIIAVLAVLLIRRSDAVSQ